MLDAYAEHKKRLILAITVMLIVGTTVLAGDWWWYREYPLKTKVQHFTVQFHNVNGLTTHAAVLCDGVLIGRIEDITLMEPHKVLVSVSVNDDRLVVPAGTKFFIHTRGLVGAEYLDIVLPDNIAGLPPLNGKAVQIGADPVRTELIAEQFAQNLQTLDMARLGDSVRRVGDAADNVSMLTKRFAPVADKAVVAERRIGDLATDLRSTTSRFNRLLGNPHALNDLKTMAADADEAARYVNEAMSKLQSLTADADTRESLSNALSTVNDSTRRIQASVERIQQMGEDKDLRSDAKQLVGDAREAIDRMDEILKNPTVGNEIGPTLVEARSAFTRIDTVGAQLSRILDKRAPLIHLLVGRPGHIDSRKMAGKNALY